MRLYHVTMWNNKKQERLVPRIPEKTHPGEDISIKRISLAPSIKECIASMADKGEFDSDNRIRVYTVDIDEKDSLLVNWKDLYEIYHVPDSPLTHEYWYKGQIKPSSYCEYKVDDIHTQKRLLIQSCKKESVLNAINGCGIPIPTELEKKTAVEILNHFMNNSDNEIEKIKKKLYHEKYECDPNQFKAIFNESIKPDFEPYYVEVEHIYNFSLIKI